MTEGEAQKTDQTIPFFPDHVMTEAKVALGLLILVALVGVLGSIWPVGLGAPADPMDTPAHTQPEWYFLFLYEMLKYLPKTLGVLIPIVGLVILALWPFVDRKQDTHKAKRARWVLAVIACIVIMALTLIGALG